MPPPNPHRRAAREPATTEGRSKPRARWVSLVSCVFSHKWGAAVVGLLVSFRFFRFVRSIVATHATHTHTNIQVQIALEFLDPNGDGISLDELEAALRSARRTRANAQAEGEGRAAAIKLLAALDAREMGVREWFRGAPGAADGSLSRKDMEGALAGESVYRCARAREDDETEAAARWRRGVWRAKPRRERPISRRDRSLDESL